MSKEALLEVLDEVSRGQVGRAQALAASRDTSSAGAIARAALAAIDPALAPRQEPASLREAAGGDPAATRAAARQATSALAAFDVPRAREWLDAFASAPDPSGALACAKVGAALLSGNADAAESLGALKALQQRASEQGDAHTVVEAAIWSAVAQLEVGPVEDALKRARRASRMARTESMPQLEYFSAIILARLRRLTGTPHLASRILNAVGRFASAQWLGWVAWELFWVDDDDAVERALARGGSQPAPSIGVGRDLLALGRGAASGDRAHVAAAMSRLSGAPRPRMTDAELATLHHHLLPGGEPPAPTAAFCAGTDPVVPLGLDKRAGAEGFKARGCVLVHPRGAWRTFPSALAVIEGAPPPLGKAAGQARMDTLVAVLALAGPEGLPTAEVFAATYGFTYIPTTHAGTFRVLLHHVRKRMAGLATISREDKRLRLVCERPFAVEDPRCTESVASRLLLQIARNPTGARSLAKALAVPLRTAQLALHELVDDGSCVRVRKGNAVEYRVEDTTFLEPTSIRARDR